MKKQETKAKSTEPIQVPASDYWNRRYESYCNNRKRPRSFSEWYLREQHKRWKDQFIEESEGYPTTTEYGYTDYALGESISYMENEYGEYERIDC